MNMDVYGDRFLRASTMLAYTICVDRKFCVGTVPTTTSYWRTK